MTVGELRATMSMREYVGWRAYWNKQAQQQQLEELKAKAKAGRR